MSTNATLSAPGSRGALGFEEDHRIGAVYGLAYALFSSADVVAARRRPLHGVGGTGFGGVRRDGAIHLPVVGPRMAVRAAQARMLCFRAVSPRRFQWKITW
jgi:hypothetical protein